MSNFKVGDKVRRISSIEELTVSDVDPSSGRFCDKLYGCWYWEADFEATQPVESPEDWVEITDPEHLLRSKTDQVYRTKEYNDLSRFGWEDVDGLGGRRLAEVNKHQFSGARCRRKDLPMKPVETLLSSGGPYVARSEYERVCLELRRISADRINHIADAANATKQRDDAIAEAVRIRDSSMTGLSLCNDEIKKLRQEVVDLRTELANERASSIERMCDELMA